VASGPMKTFLPITVRGGTYTDPSIRVFYPILTL
jgi:hypothetical protein